MRYLFILCILVFVSCATNETPDIIHSFNTDTSNLEILHSGIISTNSTHSKDAIVLDGAIGERSAGILWYFASKGHTVKLLWDGEVSSGNNRYELSITALASIEDGDPAFYPDEDYDGVPDSATDSYFTVLGLQDIEIEKLPENYKFKRKFDPPSGGGNGTFHLWLEKNDFPVEYMDFTIDSKQFSIVMTKMRSIQPMFGDATTTTTFEDAFMDGEQLFQIVDEKGSIYAEFVTSYYEYVSNNGWFGKYEYRDGSYTIFEVDEGFDEEKLIPIIGIIDILKYVTYYAETQ